MPPTTVTYGTVGCPPSPWEPAAPRRRRAVRACALRVLRRRPGPSGRKRRGLTRRERTCVGPGRSFGHWGLPSGASLRPSADGPRGGAAPAPSLQRMAGALRPSGGPARGSSYTMQAYGRVGALDHGPGPRRHRGDATRRRAGRDQGSGPKRSKVASSGRTMVTVRRRVVLLRRRTAPSRCMVAPARRVDAANDAKCPGDASAWSRWPDGHGDGPSGWHGDTDAWLGEPVR
jgi:hypothetical protein